SCSTVVNVPVRFHDETSGLWRNTALCKSIASDVVKENVALAGPVTLLAGSMTVTRQKNVVSPENSTSGANVVCPVPAAPVPAAASAPKVLLDATSKR